MSTFRLDTFREHEEAWSKLTEEGSAILASVDRKDVSKTGPALTLLLGKLKILLEKMYDECDKADGRMADGLRSTMEMYDQEYMVKESIQSIVSTSGFYTQQHLSGLAALWSAEAYIDKGFQATGM